MFIFRGLCQIPPLTITLSCYKHIFWYFSCFENSKFDLIHKVKGCFYYIDSNQVKWYSKQNRNCNDEVKAPRNCVRPHYTRTKSTRPRQIIIKLQYSNKSGTIPDIPNYVQTARFRLLDAIGSAIRAYKYLSWYTKQPIAAVDFFFERQPQLE